MDRAIIKRTEKEAKEHALLQNQREAHLFFEKFEPDFARGRVLCFLSVRLMMALSIKFFRPV